MSLDEIDLRTNPTTKDKPMTVDVNRLRLLDTVPLRDGSHPAAWAAAGDALADTVTELQASAADLFDRMIGAA